MAKEKNTKINEQKKSNLLFMMLIIFLIATIACISSFGLATWARYRTATGGNVVAQIARWNFKVNKQSEEFININLVDTISFEHVDKTKIAPGTYGSFELEMDGTGSDVSIDYYIEIGAEQKPTNMKFYLEETHDTVLTIDSLKKMYLDGELLLGSGMKETRRIYWDWAYRTDRYPSQEVLNKYLTEQSINGLQALVDEYNVEETTDSRKAELVLKINDLIDTKEAGGEVLLPIKVKGIQRNPNIDVKGVRVTSSVEGSYNTGDTLTFALEFTNDIYADSNGTTITPATAPVVTLNFNNLETANNPIAKVASLVNAQLKIADANKNATFVSVNGNILNYEYIIQETDRGTLSISKIEGNIFDENGKKLILAEIKTPQIIGGNILSEAEKLPITYSIGDSVPWVTSIQGKTLDDWKFFYEDEENDKVYLIYGNRLTSRVDIDGLMYNRNCPYTSPANRSVLLNALTKRENWSSLLNGSFDGKEYDYSGNEYKDEYMAMGAPTIEIFVKSWNAQCEEDNKLYLDTVFNKTGKMMSDGLNGYYIKKGENGSEGYNATSIKGGYDYDMYFFKSSRYWLASPSYRGDTYVCCVEDNGFSADHVGELRDMSNQIANNDSFRPVICLPSSVLKSNIKK